MKEITVTYEAFTLEAGTKEYGEAAFTMLIDAELADRFAAGSKCGIGYQLIEHILQNVEMLRNRHFVPGSIKDIRL